MLPPARIAGFFLVLIGIALCFAFQKPALSQGGPGAFTGQSMGKDRIQGEEKAVLTDPPMVPAPIERTLPTKVIVNLEIREEIQALAPGVHYNFWTFGGKVPGKFIRVREGDLVEFHLQNHPNNKNPHNIDLHAVNGPGGGASASLIAPGREATFVFRALNPGLYIYHCATAPVGMHVANGMYGLILVEPRGGLPKVDREYYVVQGEIYTHGPNGEKGLQPFSMTKAIDERADYVVFNGAIGSLMGENSLQANVGETIRLYVGNGGPNLTSAFHIIGEILDKVHIEAGSVVNENVQTTLIPPGGAAIVEFKLNTTGTYLLVDHALTRAFNKGALGHLAVRGKANEQIFAGKLAEGVYLPEGSRMRTLELTSGTAPLAPASKAQRIEAGRLVYAQHCASCHQSDGRGVEDAFPPLAESDYLNEDVERSIRIVSYGISEKITVNGQEFNAVMPALELSAQDIASVLTYVYNNWNNNGSDVTVEMVQQGQTKGPIRKADEH